MFSNTTRSLFLLTTAMLFVAICLTLTGCDTFGGTGAADLNRGISDAEVRLVALEQQLADSRAAADRALADAKADAARAADALARAQTAEETLAAQRAAAAAADAERAAAALAGKSNQVQESVKQLQDALASAKAVLETSMRPDGSVDVGAAAAGIGATLGPWGMLGGTLIGIAWGVYERGQRNKDLRSVAVALDRVSTQDSIVNGTLNTAWPKIEEALTPKARQVINANSIT
jgi:hypothetical protein